MRDTVLPVASHGTSFRPVAPGGVIYTQVRTSTSAEGDVCLRTLADGRALPVCLPRDETARRKVFADLARRNRKVMALGGTALVLMLFSTPQQAAAQEQQGTGTGQATVNLGDLDAVASVEQLDDGTFRISLTDGTTFTLPDNAVLVGQNGEFLVA